MTNYERLIWMTDEELGWFLGNIAQGMDPEDCPSCPAYNCCDPETVREDCADAFTRWLGSNVPGRQYPNSGEIRQMSLPELARWIGDNLGEKIPSGECREVCPAHEQCKKCSYNCNCCAAVWREWLSKEVGSCPS